MCDENKENKEVKKTIVRQKVFNDRKVFLWLVKKKRYIDENETNNNETTWNKGTTCGINNV